MPMPMLTAEVIEDSPIETLVALQMASVDEIRRKFQKRRQGSGGVDRIIRRLLGLEQKARQYRDGAKFVRHVVDRTGLAGFNEVWADPENLPTRTEILEPDTWIARVRAS